MPFVYDVENTGADCPIPSMPSFSQLPAIQSLPDPFEWADGRGRIENYSDWRIRRAEIGAQIQYYEIGEKPPRPDSIAASYSNGVLTVNVTVNGRTLTLTSQVVLPSGPGPFPAVIGMNSPSGSIPSSIFTSRNIAEITFNQDQVTSYSNPSNNDPYYRLYPFLNLDNTGQYSAWAWGVSRIIDGLELVQNVLPIDLKHIAVTGCSYAGKMALFAGAFDERVALTIAQESGGGATSWRYSHTLPAGSVEDIDNTNYNWFENSMTQFSGDNVSKLPEDHHELMAMCAPRALYVTANPDYTWLSNPSCDVCSRACAQVYKTLGIADRFGFSIVGGHMHCQVPDSQIPEIEAFVDRFLLGEDTVNTSNIADSPYSIDLSPWITWTNPTLHNDTTFFATLSYPSNGQVGVDTSLTFKWNKIGDAQKYIVEVSTDQSFTTISKSDSTETDTSIALNGLLENQRYYWRVLEKGTAGPSLWSSVWSFITTMTQPPEPQLVSAVSPQNGYYTFNWNKVKNADQYQIQISGWPDFRSTFKQMTTSDTLKTVSWFSEQDYWYYWRVQANNMAGAGPWSSTFRFGVMYAPTNLALQKTGSNEIALTWNNNSTIQDGFVLERAQNPDTSFAVLDTSKGSETQYVDKAAVQGQTYSYRVKAYNDSLVSAYSNVASSVTGVSQEAGTPTQFSLSQNYPNPFNPTTQIRFALPRSVFTRLTIFDLLGREVRTLVSARLGPGYYEVNFSAEGGSASGGDASRLGSGVYFYRIEAGSFVETKKLLLLK